MGVVSGATGTLQQVVFGPVLARALRRLAARLCSLVAAPCAAVPAYGSIVRRRSEQHASCEHDRLLCY
jgi:hypothetical protein